MSDIFASISVIPVFTEVIVGGHAEVVNCGLVVCWTYILQDLNRKMKILNVVCLTYILKNLNRKIIFKKCGLLDLHIYE